MLESIGAAGTATSDTARARSPDASDETGTDGLADAAGRLSTTAGAEPNWVKLYGADPDSCSVAGTFTA